MMNRRYSLFMQLSRLSEDLVGIKVLNNSDNSIPSESGVGNDTFYIWKLNRSVSDFNLEKSIPVPKNTAWFGLIEQKILFA
jgi:hypothetical protein